jgi:glycosyltransferase involved in cell wall biosynthesis
VLGDIPSLREVWGDAALFVPPGDTEALEAALISLMKNPLYRQEMADRARTRALQYTPERTAVAYLAAYQHLQGANRCAS